MRHHEEIPTHVEKQWAITKIVCDMCGALCPHPKDEDWSKDNGHSTRTALAVREYYGADVTENEADLCEDCAEWLVDSVKNGSLKRKQKGGG